MLRWIRHIDRKSRSDDRRLVPLIRSVIRMLQEEVRRLAALRILRGSTQNLGAWNRSISQGPDDSAHPD